MVAVNQDVISWMSKFGGLSPWVHPNVLGQIYAKLGSGGISREGVGVNQKINSGLPDPPKIAE